MVAALSGASFGNHAGFQLIKLGHMDVANSHLDRLENVHDPDLYAAKRFRRRTRTPELYTFVGNEWTQGDASKRP